MGHWDVSPPPGPAEPSSPPVSPRDFWGHLVSFLLLVITSFPSALLIKPLERTRRKRRLCRA